MNPEELSAELRENYEDLPSRLQKSITRVESKRAKLVVRLILRNGQVTTAEISEHGYEHPPRAVRDVREAGVPLVTNMVTDSEGNRMGSYTFGDPEEIDDHKSGGRVTLPDELKNKLYQANDGSCYVCGREYEKRYLQIDHRVPYEVAGNVAAPSEVDEFMLLCGSCQRSKSYSCENCPNWTTKDEDVCRSCYWFSTIDHEHVATEPVRRLDIVFNEDEVELYEELKERSEQIGADIQTLLKNLLSDRD